MPNLTAQLLPLEESHLLKAIRSDRHRLDALLHESFTEIGASGKTHTREDTLNSLPTESPATHTLAEFQARQLSPDIALTTYTTTRTDSATSETIHARRSSIWIRNKSSWQLIFHQGTPI